MRFVSKKEAPIWKPFAEIGAFGLVEAAMWALMEGLPRWMLGSTIFIGLLFILSLNVRVRWKYFNSIPFVIFGLYCVMAIYALWFGVPESNARLRISDMTPVPMKDGRAPFPAMDIYFDNPSSVTVSGEVSHFAAGFGNAPPSDESVLAEQDKLLRLDSWPQEMQRRRGSEIHPGDPPLYISVPNTEGILAEQFRANFNGVFEGTKTLILITTLKYFDGSRVVVTEDCVWFSGGFVRHECGRKRTFVEHTPVIERIGLLFRPILSGLRRAVSWTVWFRSEFAMRRVLKVS